MKSSSYSTDSSQLCSVCGTYTSVQDRVFNGEISLYAPWAVYLRIGDGKQLFECSASIIDTQFIITSAHCFGHFLPLTPKKLAKLVTVYAGSIKKDFNSFIQLDAEQVFVNENFKQTNMLVECFGSHSS